MSERIRVLFAIGSLGGGGSERQIVGLLKYLDRARFEPWLYLVYRQGELLSEVPADVPTVAFADEHRQSRWYWPGRLHRLQTRHLADVLRAQHVAVIYDRTFHMSLISAPASRRAGVPRVSVIVTDPERDLQSGARRFGWLKRQLLRQAYRTADRVVAVSEGVRRAAIDFYGLAPEQTRTILSPLDLGRIDRLAAEGEPPFAPDRFHVVSAGRLQEQKGYRYLLQAAEDLVQRRRQKRLLIHVLGQGPQEQELRTWVADRGLEAHVRFEGFQRNPLAYFRAAHLFCLPSLFEGLPNVLLEAMACRTPVVATDCVSGPREILDHGRYGRLVPPADAQALADAIADAMNHYEPWKQRVEAAREHVENTFSVEKGVQATEQVLLEALSRGKQDR